MKCFYHADLDGEASAAALFFHRKACDSSNYYRINYGCGIDYILDRIEKNESVFILDFSMQPFSDWDILLEKTKRVTWIDHHVAAIKAAEDTHIDKLQGLRQVGLGACVLTWKYLFHDMVPMCLKLIGDYDTWEHRYEDSKPFHTAMNTMVPTKPDSPIWGILFDKTHRRYDEALLQLVQNGKGIIKKNNDLNSQLVLERAFDIELDGLLGICLLGNRIGSTTFSSIFDDTKYDFLSCLSFDGNLWSLSMYQFPGKEHDLSQIAIKYGGGGHLGAAGFQCKEWPFEVKGKSF